MRNIKLVTSTLHKPTANANKLGKVWVINIDKANYEIRTTTKTAVHKVTNTLTRLLNKRQSLFRRQIFLGRSFERHNVLEC